MQGLELVLTLLVIAAGLAPLARRIGVPFPVVLVVGGLALALVPGLPAVDLAPDVVFLIFVPPLLFWAALTTSPRELRRNVRPIGFLAIGLVLVTAAAVAAVAHAVVPGMPWAAAFVLGAVVSPPDAAAAISVARGLGVAPRLVTLLEGETLMNDTTAFVTYRMAVAAAVTGTFSLGAAALRFVLIGLGGIATGALVGYALVWLLRFARQPAVANTLALLTPFAAYLPAERLGASGVLAVVTAGLILARYAPSVVSPRTRLQARGLWGVLEFLLTGLIFILLGMEMGRVVHGLSLGRDSHLLWQAALISGVVIVTRIAWVFPVAYVPRLLSPRLARRDPVKWQAVAFLAWAGMRGGDSLVMALAVPRATATGDPLPAREAILLISYAVIASTLVLQGLPLRPLVRRLGLSGGTVDDGEERAARQRIAEAGLAHLDALCRREKLPPRVVERLRSQVMLRTRLDLADLEPSPGQDGLAQDYRTLLETYRRMEREVLRAERETAIRLRDQEAISDEVLRQIQRDLDLEDLRIEDDDEADGLA